MDKSEQKLNEIIENLRLNLQVAEERIRRLQDSEFKLESTISVKSLKIYTLITFLKDIIK